MLELRNIFAGYGDSPVLQDISLTARSGQITAVLGANGCGKSTLLKVICGILPPSSGQLLWRKQSMQAMSRNALAQTVAYLPQNRQAPDITVERLVLHGRFPYLRYPRRYSREDHAIARQAMSEMQLSAHGTVPMRQLSGGQQQKAYIAMALTQNAPVILMDEPTTYLDVAHQLQVMNLARQLADRGNCVILVLHDLSHALTYADQVALMHAGRLVTQGTPRQVYESGMLDSVFGVRVERFQKNGNWHYFCQSP